MSVTRIAVIDFRGFSDNLKLLLQEYFAIPTGKPRWKKIRECCERLASVAALNEQLTKKVKEKK